MTRSLQAAVMLTTAASSVLALFLCAPRTVPAQTGRPGVMEQWGEVLSVDQDWLVLRNARGQQYPVSVGAVGVFVIRWPTSPDRVAPDALLEATGIDIGSYRLATDHVDVYEGSARGLVDPGLLYIQGSGLTERPIDFTFNEQVYGDRTFSYNAPVPIQGGVNRGPNRLHVVGPPLNRNPLVIRVIEGNNMVTVLPLTPAGFRMTQITPGSVALVRPGDLVFFAAVEARVKSLILEQLVVVKALPLDQFQP